MSPTLNSLSLNRYKGIQIACSAAEMTIFFVSYSSLYFYMMYLMQRLKKKKNTTYLNGLTSLHPQRDEEEEEEEIILFYKQPLTFWCFIWELPLQPCSPHFSENMKCVMRVPCLTLVWRKSGMYMAKLSIKNSY